MFHFKGLAPVLFISVVSHSNCIKHLQMARRYSRATRDESALVSQSRIYKDINVQRPPEYSDYENAEPIYGSISDLAERKER